MPPIPSALIYTPQGELAMIVHIEDEDPVLAEIKLANDPAFNPPGHTQVRVDKTIYDTCKNHDEIKAESIKALRAYPYIRGVRNVTAANSLADKIQTWLPQSS